MFPRPLLVKPHPCLFIEMKKLTSNTASLNRRPDMVENSPGTADISNCPMRNICVSTTSGCHEYGYCI